MKVKKTTKKTKMTDAEIKEAIKRDKEWMDDIDSDEGIVVPKGALKDIFGDNDDESEDEDESSDDIDIDDDETADIEDEEEEEDEDVDEEDDAEEEDDEDFDDQKY